MLITPRRGFQLDYSSGNSRRYVISEGTTNEEKTPEIKLVYLAQSGKLLVVSQLGFHLSDYRPQ